MTLSISIDGASRGNPGAAGIGVVVYDEAGEIVSRIGEYIGETTNNVAEYTALIRGLEEALKLGATSVRVQTDSELLAKQISGEFRVKAPHLTELYWRAMSLLGQFKDVRVVHVNREQNTLADNLARNAAAKRLGTGRKRSRGLSLF